ncbi:hypothetical protein [Parvibaculum sp.]|jgi:hypothetical protein|uniref:hypothetical protein n=1 Tax=Parvibaculum sp. TaxID=2024848 RepID=UPI000C6913C2|nr:hypothetical protein [Parvibaculum sp.]HAC57890.1 hypothetical protein [Rhodobiaceae bacterium]MAU61909.1 hypothetical protein [Parvibaculum sp.]MBO6666799.1 hypothetical protein [Parvibaculum sp.]MBO6693644.1 hypothetical protein [Parvibaculum sp.]MBO6713420.1 hypothetical protein [Parvibaculum sp.]|tara:strand:+ start:965 stop:1264 length:300 start_codon:yes stop_codon:yes gene_type:complete
MSVKPQRRKEEAEDKTPRQEPGGKTHGEKAMADRTPDAHDMTETDLAAEKMGNNQLQGDDQLNVQNERQAQAEVTTETESVMEGLKRREAQERKSGNDR